MNSLLRLSQITFKFLSRALLPVSLEDSLIALSVPMPLVTAYSFTEFFSEKKKIELGGPGKMPSR